MNLSKKKKKEFPEHYYNEWEVPEEKTFKEFRYECEALFTGKITRNPVYCKNITAFKKLIRMWNKSEGFNYFEIKEEHDE